MVLSVIAASVKLPVVQENSTTIKTCVLLLLKTSATCTSSLLECWQSFLPLLLIREPIISHYSEDMGEAAAQLNSKLDMRQN